MVDQGFAKRLEDAWPKATLGNWLFALQRISVMALTNLM